MANLNSYPAATLPLTGSETLIGVQTQSGVPTTVNFPVSAVVMDTLFTTLPTSDPHVAGQLWTNGSVLMVSAG